MRNNAVSIVSMTELNFHHPLRVHVDLLKVIFSEIENIATENEKEMHTTVCMYWSRKAWGVKATNMKKTFSLLLTRQCLIHYISLSWKILNMLACIQVTVSL